MWEFQAFVVVMVPMALRRAWPLWAWLLWACRALVDSAIIGVQGPCGLSLWACMAREVGGLKWAVVEWVARGVARPEEGVPCMLGV